MNSILQEMNSPTQVRNTHKEFTKEVEGVIEDDNHVMVPVTITYDYRHYYGLGWEILVTGYDCTPTIKDIHPADLQLEVKRIIEEEERVSVHFEY